MALGHWIGGAVGFLIFGGPLGAIAGAVLGGYLQRKFNELPDEENLEAARSRYRHQSSDNQQNDFKFMLLVLASYVIQADGRIMHSEMNHVRDFLRRTFGPAAVREGEEILQSLFAHRQQTIAEGGREAYERLIAESCCQIARYLDEAARLQILSFLCEIAKADGQVVEAERIALRQIATAIGLSAATIDALLSMGQSDLDSAYRVLEISPDATDEEVRRAYKRLALRHHPDRVATLGEEVRRAAERKFQEIGEAKERIYKARGLR